MTDKQQQDDSAKKPKPKGKPRAKKGKTPLDAMPEAGAPTQNRTSAPITIEGEGDVELGQDVNGGISERTDGDRFQRYHYQNPLVIPTHANTSTPQDSERSETTTTKTEQSNHGQIAGDVSTSIAETATEYATASLACEESRAKASNRWVLEGRRWETDRFRQDVIRQSRAAGMTKEQASDRAWEACLAQFPPPGVEPIAIGEPEVSTIVDIPAEPIEAAPPATPVDMGVSGLGDMPGSWGQLPANAQLQVEISWVSANRLRVRSGNGVDLSRALSPAPSYSALSWLETSILFPSKFADISVKATAQQDDEREHIRREKMSIEEIRSLLAEMLEG